MGVLDLFVVALMPVLKVLLVTAVGSFLSMDRVNLLGHDARQHMNNLVFYVFSPSLIASNLADTITLSSLVTLWFMPVNILLTFIIGSALAWVLIKLTRTPRHLRSLIIGCCAAGNLGNLLLIIIPAVCTETDSPFGDSSTCSTYGEAYASLSMAIGAVYIWSYVYTLMRISAKRAEETDAKDSRASLNADGVTSGGLPEIITEPLLAPEDSPSPNDCISQDEIYQTRFDGTTKISFLEKIRQHMTTITEHIDIKKLFAPSTIAAIIGFIIGVASPIRKLIIGDDAPLRVIYTATDLLGEAAIPCITLIIGANLLRGLKRSKVSPVVIIGVITIRYIALPLIGIGIVKAAHHYGMVGSDALYQFTLMLQYALPPAMNVDRYDHAAAGSRRERMFDHFVLDICCSILEPHILVYILYVDRRISTFRSFFLVLFHIQCETRVVAFPREGHYTSVRSLEPDELCSTEICLSFVGSN